MMPEGSMCAEQSDYVSFLLRLWSSESQEETHWRASLQEVRSGEQYGFDTLGDLFQFLDLLTQNMEREADGENHL